MPAIGELDQRIDLQSRSDSAAVGGGVTESYGAIASVWAKVDAVSGSLYFASQQLERNTTHLFTIRGRTDWAQIAYVRWDSRRFRVERVRDLDPVPRFQEILAEEIKSGV